MNINPQTPVIIVAGQYTQRWQEGKMPLEPLRMIEKVFQETTQSYPNLAGKIDSVFITNIFGYQYGDAPTQLCEILGLENVKYKEFSPLGGNTPQYHVNRVCQKLWEGELQMAFLAGAEATYSMAKAMKSGLKLDWTPAQKPSYIGSSAHALKSNSADENRLGTTDLENNYELYLLANAYPIFETALRYKFRHSPEEHQKHIGELYAPFSKVASQNQHAWQQTPYTVEEIYKPSPDNRYIAYPYTKRMCANNQVDQAAFLVLTTESIANELQIPQKQRVYPIGGADAHDIWDFACRPDIAKSEAIEWAGKMALEKAHLTLEQVDAFDVYSCFPVAVQVAREALGILPTDSRPLTLTGGLAYFGGAWNNYSMHAIAQAVENIRQKPQNILITALGWYITKHSVGIYSANPNPNPDFTYTFKEFHSTIEVLNQVNAPSFEIVGYTLIYERDGSPLRGIALGKVGEARAWAFIEGSKERLACLETEEWVGKTLPVYFDEKRKRNIVVL
jgi:acetyl-CoA C-acetyltransferase